MATPREVFDRLTEGISEGRWAELSKLYAEDAVVEHPQRPPTPTRIVGRATVHEHFTGALAASIRMRSHHVVVHETTDPEVIVAEYDYSGEALTTGKTFETANIQVLRIRDGLIVHTRDYHDYLAITAARDGLPQLAQALNHANATEPASSAEPASTAQPPSPAPRPLSTATPQSPRGVFEWLIYGVSDGRWAELPGLYAEQTHVTHPFLPGAPALTTRDQLREHFAQGPSAGTLEARDLQIYQSTDPEVVIGEFAYHGTSAIGRPLRIANIFVFRVRDGLIVESRDYADHLAFAAASGRLDDLLSLARQHPKRATFSRL